MRTPVQADMSLILAVKGGHTSMALQLLKHGASLVAVTDVCGRKSLIPLVLFVDPISHAFPGAAAG